MFGNPVRTLKRTTVGVTATLAALAAVAVPAQAGPIGACVQMRAFYLHLGTGDDDLRDNSEVIVWLMQNHGPDVELEHVWGGIGNRSDRGYSLAYQNPNWHIGSCDVAGIKVRMLSHNGIFQTDDNWNMDSISLDGYADWGRPSYSISASGSPVKRFTNSDQWWSLFG
ncbi:hypothetical protein ACTOB_003824 [Actinoplanes oblitus]|uniref:Uncharacterized protein n=1 Tax=Actinoplanes oblitus TaxID=3040509 RepID=A0ABY8WU00_9ACTN|nr:hypothetical protein [Actinoplanes oblitus]WIN00139.1 hypothetical protein ACTOB_003824 [Actinoplanes oblitus]